MKPDAWPWIALFTGPTAFLLNLQANFTMAPWVCATGNYWAPHVAHLVAFSAILWAAWHVHGVWQDAGGGPSDESSDVRARDHFLGLLALMVNVFSAGLILAQWVPDFILGACQ
jgi:hypothetical protein